MLALTSPDFNSGQTIPTRFTCDGHDVSPAFRWMGAPEGTKEYLLVCYDPDAPRGTFQHWTAFGISAKRTFLRAGFGSETKEPGFHQAINDFGSPGYGGPCPPRGDKPHAYHFRLSALGSPIGDVDPKATCAEVQALAKPLELEHAELIGFYARK